MHAKYTMHYRHSATTYFSDNKLDGLQATLSQLQGSVELLQVAVKQLQENCCNVTTEVVPNPSGKYIIIPQKKEMGLHILVNVGFEDTCS